MNPFLFAVLIPGILVLYVISFLMRITKFEPKLSLYTVTVGSACVAIGVSVATWGWLLVKILSCIVHH